jgi:hypothetical protein
VLAIQVLRQPAQLVGGGLLMPEQRAATDRTGKFGDLSLCGTSTGLYSHSRKPISEWGTAREDAESCLKGRGA